MLSLVAELLVNIAHIGKFNEGEIGHSRRRPWRVQKDEKALAARPGVKLRNSA